MSATYNLPLVITHLILEYASTVNKRNLTLAWKHSLKLLAVCQEWRAIGKCVVYRTAYLIEETPDEPDDKTEITNIDLIKSVNFAHLVRTVFVIATNEMCLGTFILTHKTIFESDKYDWTRVNCFDMTVSEYVDKRNALLIDEPSYELAPDNSFADYFAATMPNVVSVSFNINPVTNKTTALCSRIINGYGGQLRSIYNNCVTNFTAFTSQSFLANLTHLDIKLDSVVESILPKINPAALFHLKMWNVPLHFSWDYFSQNQSSNIIVFNRLKVLFLSFVDETVSSNVIHTNIQAGSNNIIGRHYVRFPKLDYLTIINNPGTQLLSAHYTFPEVIWSVTISKSLNTIQLVKESNIKEIKSLVLYVDNIGQESESEFYRLTNHYFNSKTRVSRSRICLERTHFPLDFNRINWTNLTQIHLREVIDIHHITSLLANMSELTRLSVGFFRVDSFSEFISDAVYNTDH
ncbi:hypothetical protein BX661DRAFT_188052, partial [Kickxella alabastrina]|uniref:uncharacterized protein n=1 Tax=Kickxella alabastrina TaxID=61397 RepID=UPI00221EF07F